MEWIKGRAQVPEIDDACLKARRRQMKPVVRFGKRLWRIWPCDPRGTAFTWDPRRMWPSKRLRELRRIQTDHYCGYHMFIKPSVAEVLAQVPLDLLDQVVAFEVLTDTAAVYDYGNGHRLTTVLYGAA